MTVVAVVVPSNISAASNRQDVLPRGVVASAGQALMRLKRETDLAEVAAVILGKVPRLNAKVNIFFYRNLVICTCVMSCTVMSEPIDFPKAIVLLIVCYNLGKLQVTLSRHLQCFLLI